MFSISNVDNYLKVYWWQNQLLLVHSCQRCLTTIVKPIDKAFINYSIDGKVGLSYKHDVDSLIIKYMPGILHMRISRGFITTVTGRIDLSPGHSILSYHYTGNAQFSIREKWSKEGDKGLTLSGTSNAGKSWSSFVIEVGYFQSLKSLHGAVSWWLGNSSCLTCRIIIIKIKTKVPRELYLEQWEKVDDKSQDST